MRFHWKNQNKDEKKERERARERELRIDVFENVILVSAVTMGMYPNLGDITNCGKKENEVSRRVVKVRPAVGEK